MEDFDTKVAEATIPIATHLLLEWAREAVDKLGAIGPFGNANMLAVRAVHEHLMRSPLDREGLALLLAWIAVTVEGGAEYGEPG